MLLIFLTLLLLRRRLLLPISSEDEVESLEAIFRKMLDETVLDTTSEEAVPDTPPPPHLNLLQVAQSTRPDQMLYDADESEAFFKAYKEKHGHGPFHSLLVEQCPTAPVDNLESNNYLESNNSTQSVSCDFSEEEWAQIVEAQGYLQRRLSPLSMKKADALRAKTKVLDTNVKVALNFEEVTDHYSIDEQLVDDSLICQTCACASATIPGMDLETESSIDHLDRHHLLYNSQPKQTNHHNYQLPSRHPHVMLTLTCIKMMMITLTLAME